MRKKKIAVLASGGGSNLQALLDAANRDCFPGEIVTVISNRSDAYALERAKRYGVEAQVVTSSDFPDDLSFNRELTRLLKNSEVDLVVLAGFLPILHAELVKAFHDQIINIHPSLIPSFCGKGYYGMRVHQAAIDYGVKVSGATVHFVDEGTDTGSILIQEAVMVKDDDTPETLAARVLEVEHRILPRAVKIFCEDRFEKKGRKIIVRGELK